VPPAVEVAPEFFLLLHDVIVDRLSVVDEFYIVVGLEGVIPLLLRMFPVWGPSGFLLLVLAVAGLEILVEDLAEELSDGNIISSLGLELLQLPPKLLNVLLVFFQHKFLF
jgi:hypothetical protein